VKPVLALILVQNVYHRIISPQGVALLANLHANSALHTPTALPAGKDTTWTLLTAA